MAYGTPRTPADIESYYTHIRRGRPPSNAQLTELAARYDAIGGISPLAERTEAQRTAIARELAVRAPGSFTVVLGQKHAAPFIEDGVRELADAGATSIIGLVLAPHYSRMSVGQYHDRGRTAAAERELPYTSINSWHLLPEYLWFLERALIDARERLPAEHKVLFTAHSLPERALVDDPYPDQLRETAEAVADGVGLRRWPDWSMCWQSAGRTPEPWRGPDVLDVIRDLGATGRSEGVLVCAQGFVSDHLEVLYDLDVEARQVASEVGLTFARTRSLNDDPVVMGGLADVIATAATAAAAERA
jgi:ferrochelatase